MREISHTFLYNWNKILKVKLTGRISFACALRQFIAYKFLTLSNPETKVQPFCDIPGNNSKATSKWKRWNSTFQWWDADTLLTVFSTELDFSENCFFRESVVYENCYSIACSFCPISHQKSLTLRVLIPKCVKWSALHLFFIKCQGLLQKRHIPDFGQWSDW